MALPVYSAPLAPSFPISAGGVLWRRSGTTIEVRLDGGSLPRGRVLEDERLADAAARHVGGAARVQRRFTRVEIEGSWVYFFLLRSREGLALSSPREWVSIAHAIRRVSPPERRVLLQAQRALSRDGDL